MPRRFFRGRNRMRPTVNTEKHVVEFVASLTATNTVQDLAVAVTAPSNTVSTDCHRGGHIKTIWISIDVCGLAASGVLQRTSMYLIKNVGNNLTPPGVFVVGTSNEKRFVIKQWTAMTMRNQDGNNPYHWEGWIKVPKVYHRMATDDKWQIVWAGNTSTGHGVLQCIYKEQF